MKVLHINTYDSGGGAEVVAMQLVHNQPDSFILVKTAILGDKQVLELPKNKTDHLFHFIDQLLWKAGIHKKFKRIFFLEDEFNSTYSKLSILHVYKQADIIHLHNLHGGYFNLKALLKIAKEKKIVWTLHDMWCMTGGEAYTFDNDNYKKGIGFTPYVHLYPLRNSVIDRRQHYMNLKKKIYQDIAGCVVFVPVSKWLESCFQSSFVFNNMLNTRVINNGFESDIFNVRYERNWSIPRLMLFNQNSTLKGHEYYESILPYLPEQTEITIIGKPLPFTLKHTHHYLPFFTDRNALASCYSQHDILLFPSKADNFPLVLLEAMACGVCVIASNLGGIPEIIEHGKTGFLFTTSLEALSLFNNELSSLNTLRAIGKRASTIIPQKFSLQKMYANYDALYAELLASLR